MSDLLFELLGFAAKAIMVTLSFGAIALLVGGMIGRRRTPAPDDEGTLVVTPLHERFRRMSDVLRRARMGEKKFKAYRKALGTDLSDRPAAYVCNFDGDTTASAVDDLSQVVTAIVGVAEEGATVVVRLRSPGGTVPGYGLGASQLGRLRAAGLRVVVAVDTVAASGGYMMAVVGDEIVAAPFAIVGSIGVYMSVPNVHRLLRDKGVDVQEMTSGRYKRTVSMVNEFDPEGIAKTQEMLDDTHALFKEHVKARRPQLDMDTVATGEHWYGQRALDLGLVDRLATSDDVIAELAATSDVFLVRMVHAGVGRRMLGGLVRLLQRARF